MKQVLVIGSAVADVVIHVKRLPRTGEDIHIESQTMAPGGCAYNVYNILRLFQAPALLFAPVGTGIYGDFIRRCFQENGMGEPALQPDEPNGCCYCLVEESGERSFLCEHGAEYRFRREWLDGLRAEDYDCVYICGIEIEEETGGAIIEFLEKHPELPVYFAPGPRVTEIDRGRMERIAALQPILHLNESEALAYADAIGVRKSASSSVIEKAAYGISELTGNNIVITLGARGSYCLQNGIGFYCEGEKTAVADTIGAGDSHIGAVIACRQLGLDLVNAVKIANKVSAAVVAKQGAGLSEEQFKALNIQLKA